MVFMGYFTGHRLIKTHAIASVLLLTLVFSSGVAAPGNLSATESPATADADSPAATSSIEPTTTADPTESSVQEAGGNAGDKSDRRPDPVGLFAVGIAVAGLIFMLLLWLGRLQDAMFTRATSGEPKAGLRDLERYPLGVPPGSLRGVLALLVVATSMLLFVLVGAGYQMPDALVGILGMVLGFYFGTRTGGGDELKDAYQVIANKAEELGQQKQTADAASTAKDEAERKAREAEQKRKEAEQQNQDMSNQVGALQQQAAAPPLIALLNRLKFATNLLAAYKETGPETDLSAYEGALQAAAILAEPLAADSASVTPEQRAQLEAALAALPDHPGDATTLIGAPLAAAGTILSNLPLTGTEDARAKVALLLAVGWSLGSDSYQRWKARILWAPIAQLLDEKSISDEDLDAAADQVMMLQDIQDRDLRRRLLRHAVQVPTVDVESFAEFGPEGTIPLIDNIEGLPVLIKQFRQKLLSMKLRKDITIDVCNSVSLALDAAKSVLRVTSGAPTPDQVVALLDAAAEKSSEVAEIDAEDPADPAIVNLHMLVLCVDYARRDKLNMLQILSGLTDPK